MASFPRAEANPLTRLRYNIFIFVGGFIVRHMIGYLIPFTPWSGRNANMNMQLGRFSAQQNDVPINHASPVLQGIYPLMRDFQCGHGNMETPRALKNTAGRGRIVIDVGLFDGEEMLDAVENGFVVFGFEVMRGSMDEIRINAEKRGILDRLHFVGFIHDKKKGIPVAKDLPKPPTDGRGFAYVFNAGLSDEVGSVDANRGHNQEASMRIDEVEDKWVAGRVPILRLDQVLPEWVNHIFFLKIDTQGYEWKVLNGAAKYLQS